MGSSQVWKNRTAVISGGSNGLGRALALALSQQSANVVIIGRDPDRLASVREQCLEAGAQSVSVVSLDVRQLAAGKGSLVDFEIASKPAFGESLRAVLAVQGCDLLINAIGKSDRGLLGQLTAADLTEQFELNVLATHAMTRFCFPALCQSRGVVVNIASLAGIVPGPGMGGYSMSKHALVGLHRQWRIESDSSGVHFLLVCPGPIQRDDTLDRYSDIVQSRGLDPVSQRPGGGVALGRLDPDGLSQKILQAAAQRRWELIVPGKVRLLAMLMAIWPSFVDRIIRKKMKRP
ncbi:MAG: SDR family NAD(P)-dependent oxidoreductase [Planctomycetota bacterium]|nr:SDR family NAD(P)-dependent oxidoreductase [Planctomycetota bacterium]